ncbi:MAG: bifunctional phosphoribosyl-AMP cyclohydrolase/phosphoribosyl-ATP diphosphatase HisIE [Candidatus Calescibacterium sp.]|nr:bifunctional phosphoribosyl-AMP cyclohydrolase/phosphoribosyl-ATP diphosphatase HisIE [Candidatus Calescibacterium sp.]MCX7733752.1 bifunctional phosphoribosyl-AMP cyclohydrolase/phosphoribosyl-ATP diphosphatase HisIE [bacterium]MDW8086684.1 bifunctional phosphoribosyl-AMP cyclohydrolase/phosphoribosyl-ATP diphosphatase HisIE [Candidatus Calescibacterium sp.]
MSNKEKIDFSGGLIPTVVVDSLTGKLLMLAFSSPESLKLTFQTGFAHFFSRKRQKIWKKGEESGNTLKIEKVFIDCDNDSIIFIAEPSGPTCHTGEPSCFFRKVLSFGDDQYIELKKEDLFSNVIFELQDILRDRKKNPKIGSYTSELFSSGLIKLTAKIMEEAQELCDSAVRGVRGSGKDSVVWEASDLIYHFLALLVFLDVPFEDVLKELKRRRGGK